jgi:archaellin
MNRYIVVIIALFMTAANNLLIAQETEMPESSIDLSTETTEQSTEYQNTSASYEDDQEVKYVNTSIAPENEKEQPSTESHFDQNTTNEEESDLKEERSRFKKVISPLKISATVDMQMDKEMYEEFHNQSENRFTKEADLPGLRKMVDDFWLRVAIRMSYRLKYFESAFALRFYPYWTMRTSRDYTTSNDLTKYLDVLELNQAYLKMFKEYSRDQFSSTIHLKIGRDGLQNSCSELFGNYLDQPTGGYGDSKSKNITGPFKNRKVFANQMEVGLQFNLGKTFGGRTSVMIGGNLNNEKWYGAPYPAIYQQLDSKFNAGFLRIYQDFYFLGERIHLGGGFRKYTTKVDSAFTKKMIDNEYINAQWAFDIVIIPDLKFYTELAFQKLGSDSRTGVVRPINIGITIPTGKVLDVLAVEFENVAKTFFSDESMRDAVGRFPTKALAWGIVVEKRFYDRVNIAWGLYTGNPTGDMKTSLRIASDF